MGYVYGLKLDTGSIRYVGQTIKSPEKRLTQHKYSARSGGDLPVQKWIRKYGEDRVQIVILSRCDNCRLDELEIHWIKFLRDCGHRLLNCTDGGAGSPDLKQRSASQRGVPKSEETRRKMSAHVKTPEHRAKISAALSGKPKPNLRGVPRPQEVRDKIAAANRGQRRSAEARSRMSEGQRRRYARG